MPEPVRPAALAAPRKHMLPARPPSCAFYYTVGKPNLP